MKNWPLPLNWLLLCALTLQLWSCATLPEGGVLMTPQEKMTVNALFQSAQSRCFHASDQGLSGHVLFGSVSADVEAVWRTPPSGSQKLTAHLLSPLGSLLAKLETRPSAEGAQLECSGRCSEQIWNVLSDLELTGEMLLALTCGGPWLLAPSLPENVYRLPEGRWFWRTHVEAFGRPLKVDVRVRPASSVQHRIWIESKVSHRWLPDTETVLRWVGKVSPQVFLPEELEVFRGQAGMRLLISDFASENRADN